ITVSSVDSDDTQGSATISGVPSGWTLYDNGVAQTLTSGSATIASGDVGKLSVLAPDGSGENATLTLTASSSEGSSTTSATRVITVSATAVAEPPTFGGGTSFSGSDEGTIALSGITVASVDSDDTLGSSVTV